MNLVEKYKLELLEEKKPKKSKNLERFQIWFQKNYF